MARPHVPKFGDWDNGNANTPFTQCFENARRAKSGIRMNPNDPEENPEALVNMRGGVGLVRSNSDRQSIRAPPSFSSTISAPNRRRSYDHQNVARGRKIMASESCSEKSSSTPDPDLSGSRSNPRRANFGQKNLGLAGRSSFSSSYGSGQSSSSTSASFTLGDSKVQKHKKASSIPKFGDWDEKNPKSGENFTEIFEQAKAEKKDPSPEFPLPPESQSNEHQPRLSKMFCCIFPRGADQ